MYKDLSKNTKALLKDGVLFDSSVSIANHFELQTFIL
jgi:hypothetical protein